MLKTLIINENEIKKENKFYYEFIKNIDNKKLMKNENFNFNTYYYLDNLLKENLILIHLKFSFINDILHNILNYKKKYRKLKIKNNEIDNLLNYVLNFNMKYRYLENYNKKLYKEYFNKKYKISYKDIYINYEFL